MSNQEILEKAIQKAIDGGWKTPLDEWEVSADCLSVYHHNKPSRAWESQLMWFQPISELIFNHDFAKALWGEELHQETFIVPKELNKRFAGTKDLDIKPTWMYHLQQMVIAEDPVQYLGENL